MNMRKMIGSAGHDPLAERRAEEIDEVLDRVVPIRPTSGRDMFESFFLAYIALASLSAPRTVILSQSAYERARAGGLLEWLAQRYPQLTVEPPSKNGQGRGYRVDHVVFDEVASMEEVLNCGRANGSAEAR